MNKDITLSEAMDLIDICLTESERTDREKEDAKKKEDVIKQLKIVNKTGIAVNSIGAACTAILAGEYALAIKKVNDEIKKLEADLKVELEKKVKDENKVDELKQKIKKLKRSKILISAYIGATAVTGARVASKISKGLENNKKLDNMEKTTKAEQSVVATYDKDGVKEESVKSDAIASGIYAGATAAWANKIKKISKKIEDINKEIKEEEAKEKPDTDKIVELKLKLTELKRGKNGAIAMTGLGGVLTALKVKDVVKSDEAQDKIQHAKNEVGHKAATVENRIRKAANERKKTRLEKEEGL